MKTRIIINLNLPGIHAWPGVVNTQYKDTQGYLQFPHRHDFHINAQKEVEHDDRDVEIIDLKNQIIATLKKRYWNDDKGCLMLGSMSCEMLAQELCQIFELVECIVLEDGENGAVAYYNEQLDQKSTVKTTLTTNHVGHNPSIHDVIEHNVVFGEQLGNFINNGENITFVCGYLCSGKSTLGWAYADGLVSSKICESVGYLEISDIVKKVKKVTKREELQGNPDLDVHIIAEISDMSRKFEHLIVGGARQLSILKAFPKASAIWLDVPEKLRYARYQNSSKDQDKSFDAFAVANTKDLDLGLQQVKDYIFSKQRLKHSK